MRPLTEFIPKPLLPLLDKSMVFHVLHALQQAGIRNFIVNLYTHAEAIRKVLSQYAAKNGLNIRFLYEPELLNTGGALRNARKYLRESFFLVNSDFVPTNFSFNNMEKKHTGLATLAVRLMKHGEPYNPVGVDKKGNIVRVSSVYGKGGKDYQFLGVHRLEPECLEFLDRRKVFPIFTGLYNNLFNAGHIIKSFRCRNSFPLDPGTIPGYMEANRLLLRRLRRKNWIGPGVIGLDEATIGNNSVISGNVNIGSGAKINSSVIFPQVNIPAGSVIENSIVGSSPPGDLQNKIYIHEKEISLL